ncbi:MAG: hypothetical protein RLO21_04855 [Nitratireductor sp.]
MSSEAGELVADFSVVEALNGPLNDVWFGYRTDDVQIYAHPAGSPGFYEVPFNTGGASVVYEVEAEILSGDENSTIGLFCCRPEGSERAITLEINLDGRVVVRMLDDEGEAYSSMGRGGRIDTSGGTVLRIEENGHGFEAFVNGESVGSVSESSYSANNGGIFVQNGGVYAVHDFNIYKLD